MPPGDIKVFSFGDRISSLTDQYIWDIRDYESAESIDEWCRRIAEIDSTQVSALMQRISTVFSIDGLFDTGNECIDIDGFVHIGAEKAAELAMFTKLVLHQYDGAMQAANSLLVADNNGQLRVTKRMSEYCKLVVELAATKDDHFVDSTISKWRDANTRRFIL
jgi:hypothetical protein